MQKKLALNMGSARGGYAEVPDHLISRCKTEQEAMRLTMNQSRHYWDFEKLAFKLGLVTKHGKGDKGTLNKMLNCDRSDRNRFMSRVMQVEFQRLCGNRSLDRWADMYDEGGLDHQNRTTLAQRLREEADRLEAEEAEEQQRSKNWG